MTYQEVIQAREYFAAEYLKARDKYPSLPTIEEIDAEWDIIEVVSRHQWYPRNVVRFVRHHVMEGVNSWAGYLHNFILPNSQNAASMEEYNYLSEKEKQAIVLILNWIMYRNREMNMLQLDEDDAKSVTFITDTYKEWVAHKKEIGSVLEKNMGAWKSRIKH